MATNDSYEFDYPPGYTKPTHEYGQSYGDEFHAEAVQELLLSMAGYTQRGVTLAPGQGVLPTGTVLARHTASGLYFAYSQTASDGRQVALGVLRDSRDTGGTGYTTLSAYNGVSGNPQLTNTTGSTIAFGASPAGKTATTALGNLVYRGILNSNLVSGGDQNNLVSNTGGGVGNLAATSGNFAPGCLVQLGARVVPFGSGGTAFPGGPMDGQPGNVSGSTAQGVSAFIF